MQGTRTANRGFASMDSHKQREIARKGGQAAHVKGTAHEFTRDEARAAGRKGGERVSTDREHMSRIGRIGGKSSAGKRQTGRSPETGSVQVNQGSTEPSTPEIPAQGSSETAGSDQ
jgi:general stress protein YciG